MCFGGGPSEEEKKAAAEQRAAAESQKQAAIQEKAQIKRENIESAVTASSARKGSRGGTGRRSLYSAPSGQGFLGRFG